jgi:hypothetical protein
MIKLKSLLAAVALCAATSASSFAAGSATVLLNGDNFGFLQTGTVTNTSAAGVDIVGIVYDLGAPAAGISIFDGAAVSSGTQSNFLTGSWYSTQTWSALATAAGSSFTFAGLNLDLITGVAPPTITKSVIGGPDSLANASFSVFFSDGSSGTVALLRQDWSQDQRLNIASAVPEPQTAALLALGLGVMVWVARRRRPQ